MLTKGGTFGFRLLLVPVVELVPAVGGESGDARLDRDGARTRLAGGSKVMLVLSVVGVTCRGGWQVLGGDGIGLGMLL